MRVSLRIGFSGTNDTVRLREVSALGRFHCILKFREVFVGEVTKLLFSDEFTNKQIF